MKSINVKGYENYLISKDGNVYNTIISTRNRRIVLDEPKQLKIQTNSRTGYSYIVLNSGKFKKGFSIHRLVAETYIKNPLNLPEVNHKNKNKTDNSVSNLEWVTKKQNIQHHIMTKVNDGGKLFNYIIQNKTLLNDGIELYNKIGKLNARFY